MCGARAGGTSDDVMGNFPMHVYGKTGTAELGNSAISPEDAWYACYVPASETNKPIVVVVNVEKGGFGDVGRRAGGASDPRRSGSLASPAPSRADRRRPVSTTNPIQIADEPAEQPRRRLLLRIDPLLLFAAHRARRSARSLCSGAERPPVRRRVQTPG